MNLGASRVRRKRARAQLEKISGKRGRELRKEITPTIWGDMRRISGMTAIKTHDFISANSAKTVHLKISYERINDEGKPV